MFETRRQRIIPPHHFARRLAYSFALSGAIAAIALTVGIVGFHYIADVPWIDALHNASMILGGMGPVAELTETPAKIFASFYALFSGLVFVVVMGVVSAPILHRVLHTFHMTDQDERSEGK